MRITIDENLQRLIQGLNYNEAIPGNTLEVKRRDTPAFDTYYVEPQVAVIDPCPDGTAGVEFTFGAKIPGDYSGSYILSETAFSKITTDADAPFIRQYPSLDTAELAEYFIDGAIVSRVADETYRLLLTGLALGDIVAQEDNGTFWAVVDPEHLSNPDAWELAPEKPFVDLDAEFQRIVAGKVQSSITFTLRVHNDINRGDEVPVSSAASTRASQAEAEAGTSNSKWMSPLRAAQAIAAQAVSIAGDTMTGQLRFGAAVNPVASFDNVKVLGSESITGHAKYFSLDASVIEMDGSVSPQGHASFAVAAYIQGSHNFDHHHAFQDMTRYVTSADVARYASYYSFPQLLSGAVDVCAGFYAASPSPGATVDHYYGFYAAGETSPSADSYAFYSEGPAESRFGGRVTSADYMQADFFVASRLSAEGSPSFASRRADNGHQWAWGMDLAGTPGAEQYLLKYFDGAAWSAAAISIDAATPTILTLGTQTFTGVSHTMRASSDGTPYHSARYSNLTGMWAWGMDVAGTPGAKEYRLAYFNGSTWETPTLAVDPASPHIAKMRTVDAATEYRVAGLNVVGARGAAVADATDAASAITQLNALLARLRAHGLIAA